MDISEWVTATNQLLRVFEASKNNCKFIGQDAFAILLGKYPVRPRALEAAPRHSVAPTTAPHSSSSTSSSSSSSSSSSWDAARPPHGQTAAQGAGADGAGGVDTESQAQSQTLVG